MSFLAAISIFLFALVFYVPASHQQSTPNAYPSALVPKQLIYQYDPITWVENLAIRPNGLILPITTTSPLLNQLNPKTGTLEPIHDFSASGKAIQGITQVKPDVFVLNVLTCDILNTLACTPRSVTTFSVRFCPRHHDGHGHTAGGEEGVEVKEIASFPDAGFLNGIAALNEDVVLMADSYLGGIWSLRLGSGRKELLFTDPSMNGTEDVATGINGLRVRVGGVGGAGVLYFTNSAKGTFNRIPIDDETGMKADNAELIVEGLDAPDDLEIEVDEEGAGVAYVCNGALNLVLRVDLQGERIEIVAELPGPTSVRWDDAWCGEKERVLYASTIGGLAQYVQQNATVGGAVYRLEV